MKTEDLRAEIDLIPAPKSYGTGYVSRRAVMELVPCGGVMLDENKMALLLFYVDRERHDSNCPANEWTKVRPMCICGDDQDRADIYVLLGVHR